jgi:hypothetical protein
MGFVVILSKCFFFVTARQYCRGSQFRAAKQFKIKGESNEKACFSNQGVKSQFSGSGSFIYYYE